MAKQPASTLQLPSLGAYGQGEAFGTQGWVDPNEELVGVFLIQRSSGGDAAESNAFANMVK